MSVPLPISEASARRQRLVFHDLAVVDRDPQDLAARLAQHYDVLDYGVRPGFETDFLHRTSTAKVGQLMLSCGLTSPIMGTIGGREDVGSINLIFSGAVTYGADQREFLVNPQRPLFFAPSQTYNYIVDHHYNGIVFDIDLIRLRRTAAAMAGLGVSDRRFASDFDAMRAIQPSTVVVRELLQVLCRAFRMLDQQELHELGYVQHLAVDDLIYRNLALLLSPKLRYLLGSGSDGDSVKRSHREHVFEELLDWIDANLQSTITLTQLEQISGYSRRNLQLAFQQRFGCGPIQWVRRQRLDRAREDLLSADRTLTVAEIATRYGFSSSSVFSRDFRTLFKVRPSDALREGRRHQG